MKATGENIEEKSQWPARNAEAIKEQRMDLSADINGSNVRIVGATTQKRPHEENPLR